MKHYVDVVDTVLRTNVLGTLAVSAAFAPVLVVNGGGAIANVQSAGSWLAGPGNMAYAVSKAAALSLTNSMRAELNLRGVQVTAILFAIASGAASSAPTASGTFTDGI